MSGEVQIVVVFEGERPAAKITILVVNILERGSRERSNNSNLTLT